MMLLLWELIILKYFKPMLMVHLLTMMKKQKRDYQYRNLEIDTKRILLGQFMVLALRHHILIPVGLPSTEITGVIVNENATETLDKAKQNIVDNGFFIPIYGLDGKLLFTLIHYDQMRNSQAELTSAV